jgi:Tfp pilus assembly PilM family ATPase
MSFLQGVLDTIDRMFPVPRYLTFNSVAIDISPRKIRLMKLRPRGKDLVPALYEEVALNKVYELHTLKSVRDINPKEVAGLVDALKKMKQKHKLQYVTVALPEMKTYIFRTQLPAAAADDLSAAIRYEVEENVPLSIHDVNFDFFVIKNPERKKTDKIDVVVYVFPKSIIAIYTKILEMAGLEPISFQAESVAIAKAIIKDGDDNPYLLARLLDDRVNLAIVENGVVQYASSMNVNVLDVIKDYENSPEAKELREGLSKLLIFWFTNKGESYQRQKIQTALIAGDHATAPGMEEFLEKYLNINVDIANVWSNCFDVEKVVSEIPKEDALKYAVAIGLSRKVE